MARVQFSDETIEKLRRNKYVLKVSDRSIQFSSEFKAILVSESLKGKPQKTILSELGIDPSVMGDKRIHTLFTRVREHAKRPTRFERAKSPGRPKKLIFSSPEEENKYLKDKIEYLEQENEFLKKLKALERGE